MPEGGALVPDITPRFLDDYDTVSRNIPQHLNYSRRPLNFDAVHARRPAQAKVKAEVIL